MTITLLTGSHKLYFHVMKLHLCCPEIAEDREMSTFSQHLFQFRCHLYPTAHDDDINIVGRTFQKDITHIASHHIALYA